MKPLPDATESKEALRERMRALLRAHSAGPDPHLSDASAVLAQLKAHGLWDDAEEIVAFASMRLELPTDPIIEEAIREGRRVALPRITDGGLHFHYAPYWPPRFSTGPMNLREPESDWSLLDLSVHAQRLAEGKALFLCPGLAFDRRGGRLGWGGGYYDRTLGPLRAWSPDVAARIVAIGYSIQLIEHIPMDAQDIRVPMVCTPDQLVYCSDASQGVSSDS